MQISSSFVNSLYLSPDYFPFWYASLGLSQQRTSGYSWVNSALFINIPTLVISKVQKRKAALLKCVLAFRFRTGTIWHQLSNYLGSKLLLDLFWWCICSEIWRKNVTIPYIANPRDLWKIIAFSENLISFHISKNKSFYLFRGYEVSSGEDITATGKTCKSIIF